MTAQRHGPAAKLLAVMSEEQVGALHRGGIAREDPHQLLPHGPVTRRIAGALDSKTETQRYVRATGGHRRDRDVRAEEKNLVDAGVADRRKALERLPRLPGVGERAAKIAGKVLGYEPGRELDACSAQLRNDAARSAASR